MDESAEKNAKNDEISKETEKRNEWSNRCSELVQFDLNFDNLLPTLNHFQFDSAEMSTVAVPDGSGGGGGEVVMATAGSNGSNVDFQRKYEDEKCKRLHCEKVIQDQNEKLLQLEERLVVACRMDQKKNGAISKVRLAFEKVSTQYDSLEMTNRKLNEELKERKTEYLNTQKKLEVCEEQLSKTLNLLFENQESLKNVEDEKLKLISDLESIQISLQKAEKMYSNAELKQKQLKKDFEDLKNVMNDEMKKASNLEKICDSQKTELKTLRNDTEKERKKLKEVNESKLTELKRLQLTEIQSLENKFKNEVTLKEKLIMKLAADRINELNHQHQQEIKLLEAKHKEECNLFALNFYQSIQKIENLQVESLKVIKSNFKDIEIPLAITGRQQIPVKEKHEYEMGKKSGNAAIKFSSLRDR